MCGNEQIVKILLEGGANIGACDKVFFISKIKKNEIILLLFIFLSFMIKIIYSLISNIICSLFTYFKFFKKDGQTPLHKAALLGYEQIVELLLERGANIEALNKVFFYFKNEKNHKTLFLNNFFFNQKKKNLILTLYLF